MHARRGNLAVVAGQVAAATMEKAHAVMCERGEWVCNEKRFASAYSNGWILLRIGSATRRQRLLVTVVLNLASDTTRL